MGRSFVVRTDHRSLKFILDQRLSTIPQHNWVSKLFGYDLTVEYHPGKQMWWLMLSRVMMRRCYR